MQYVQNTWTQKWHKVTETYEDGGEVVLTRCGLRLRFFYGPTETPPSKMSSVDADWENQCHRCGGFFV